MTETRPPAPVHRTASASPVIGHGDLPFAAYLQLALASVRPPAAEIGSRAADLLFERIQGSTAPATTLCLPPELKARASAGGDDMHEAN